MRKVRYHINTDVNSGAVLDRARTQCWGSCFEITAKFGCACMIVLALQAPTLVYYHGKDPMKLSIVFRVSSQRHWGSMIPTGENSILKLSMPDW